MNEQTVQQFANCNLLVTTDKWFTAPDGKQYQAVWGKVCIYKDKELLGVETNERSTNWYAVIGRGNKRVIVAGCQIHFACISPKKPNIENTDLLPVSETSRQAFIYLAQ